MEYTGSEFDHDEKTFYSPQGNFGNKGTTHVRRSSSGMAVKRALLDMNGDGFVDLVETDDGQPDDWAVYLGGLNGFEYGQGGGPALWWDRSALQSVNSAHMRDTDR